MEGVHHYTATLFAARTLAIAEKKDGIERIISTIPLNIHITTISAKEFVSMAKSREFSVVSEALKNNIILNGIEEYYRLVENAGR